jgi:hypothetical protein
MAAGRGQLCIVNRANSGLARDDFMEPVTRDSARRRLQFQF